MDKVCERNSLGPHTMAKNQGGDMEFQTTLPQEQPNTRNATAVETVLSMLFRSLPLRHGPHRLIDRLVPKAWTPGPVVVSVPFRGRRVEIDVSDLVGWHFLLMRNFDPEVSEVLQRFAAEEDVFWDIGANKGVLSYGMAADLPGCKVVAIEPQRSMHGPLRRNLEALAPGRHEVFGVGIGETAGSFELVVPDGNHGMASLVAEKRDGAKVEVVEVVTAETVRDRSRFGWPSLVKIDVEGFELPVMCSLMPAFQARHIRCCVFECHAHQGKDFRLIGESLAAFGYKLYAVKKTPFSTRLIPAPSLVRGSTDYAAIREDLAQTACG